MNTLRFIVCTCMLLFVVASCKKDEQEQKVQGEYLYDYELIKSYTKEEVQQQIMLGGALIDGFDTLLSYSEYGVDVYRVLYNTILKSSSILASGLLCVPKARGEFPFISFQNGTNTCHMNAPSQNTSSLLYSLISVMAGSGYIITIPDYIGYGESQNVLHPYHHKESSNDAITDMLLAANELVISGTIEASTDNSLYLLGYSQGGWATMSVLKEFEQDPVSGFTVKAAACGAGAYNLYAMSKYIIGLEKYETSFYMPFFVESHRQNGFLSISLNDVFNAPYPTTIPDLLDGSLCNTELSAQFPSDIATLLTGNFIDNFETATEYSSLRDALKTNTVGAWNANSKIRLYHSTGDKSVPSFLSDSMYVDLLESGVSLSNISYVKVEADTIDHNDAILPWGVDAISWINGLEGK